MSNSVAIYLSKGISKIPNLESFVGLKCVLYSNKNSNARFVIGWGRKETSIKARKYARSLGLQFVSIEDGFLRSLGLGVSNFAPHSLVLDYSGIYYDARSPSDLELLINSDQADDFVNKRSNLCMELICHHRLSKYNHAPDLELPSCKGISKVLVVDQTLNDASVIYGYADANTFVKMLDDAILDNPGSEILVKIHPDVVCGKKKGFLLDAANERRCHIIFEDINPWSLFSVVHKVYVVTSQLGFEALMAGKKVICYGLPFYAGWGLTVDIQHCDRRGKNRSLAQVFSAAYIDYARYVNPYTGKRCELEDTINLISDQKRHSERLKGKWIGVGFSGWKRYFIRDFLGQSSTLTFKRKQSSAVSSAIKSNSQIVAWSSRIDPKLVIQCHQNNIKLWRMEDGFIRSVGLGGDLVRPMSLVIDALGIYYDATKPSDLEYILSNHLFPDWLLARARLVRTQIVKIGLSKYNTGTGKVPNLPDGRRLILVPGQVETDASIEMGSPIIKANQELLAEVRTANPDAYIIYKPHPDVLTGGRMGDLPSGTSNYYDLLVTDIAMPTLLHQVDEVHTMSSLTGFEALLRGIKVFTYGLPFYAGWGLTVDKLVCDRRNRKLTLDQLVAGALVLYPTYVEPETGQICNIETIIELIKLRKNKIQGPPIKTRIYRFYRKLFEHIK